MRSFWTLTFFKILTIYFTLMTCITGTIINQISRFNVNYYCKTYDQIFFYINSPFMKSTQCHHRIGQRLQNTKEMKKAKENIWTHAWLMKNFKVFLKKEKKTKKSYLGIFTNLNELDMLYVCTEIKKRRDGNIWYAKRETYW